MEEFDVNQLLNDGLTRSQVARVLKVSGTTVDQFSAGGRLRFIQTPLGRVYDRETVQQLAHERKGRKRAIRTV